MKKKLKRKLIRALRKVAPELTVPEAAEIVRAYMAGRFPVLETETFKSGFEKLLKRPDLVTFERCGCDDPQCGSLTIPLFREILKRKEVKV